MNTSQMPPPPSGFQDRLEAELVKVVSERAVRAAASSPSPSPPSPSPRRRAATAARRPAIRAGGLTVAVALAVTAWVALGGPLFGQRQVAPSVVTVGGGNGPAHVSTAAFTLAKEANGTIRVTWDKARYIQGRPDIARLQDALRAAGLPVLIKEGVFCVGPHDGGQLGAGGVGPGVGAVMTGEDRPGGDVVFTFTPSAMPAGDELFIGYLSPSQLAVTHGRPGSVERLVPAGVPLTCTSQLPVISND